MKICTLCNTTKHLSEFKLDKKRIDGVSSWCKNCNSIKGNKLPYDILGV